MKNRIVALSLIALAASAAGAGTAQELTQPTVNVYRVLQNVEGSETTVVEGLFRVDPALVGAACDYTAEVDICDARGQSLQKDKWDGACQQQNGTPVAALETFKFGMPKGETFTVIVSVNSKDKPKEKHTRTLTVKSLPSGSVTSDLILGRQVGLVDSASASQWTIRRGAIGIRAASEIVVEPASPSLAYYLEVYPGKELLSGIAWGVVRRPDGVELNRFQLQKLDSVSTFRPAPSHHSPYVAQFASLSSTAGKLTAFATRSRSGKFRHPRFGDWMTVPLGRCSGPGAPMPMPAKSLR